MPILCVIFCLLLVAMASHVVIADWIIAPGNGVTRSSAWGCTTSVTGRTTRAAGVTVVGASARGGAAVVWLGGTGSAVSALAAGAFAGFSGDTFGQAAGMVLGTQDGYRPGQGLSSAAYGMLLGVAFQQAAALANSGASPLGSRLIAGSGHPAAKACGGAGGGASSSILHTTDRNLQKMFAKHGSDFGLSGNWNPGRAADVSRAINAHINGPGVQTIRDTYRGQNVIHHYDPKTGLNVISDPSGGFIGGWKLGPKQIKSVTSNGQLF